MAERNFYEPPSVPVVELDQEAVVIKGKFASLSDRFLGSLIDGIIFLVLHYGVEGILSGLGASFLHQEILVNLCVMAVFLALQSWFWFRHSQSIRKMILRAQIVDQDSHKPSSGFRILFLREIPLYLFTTAGSYWLLWTSGPVNGAIYTLYFLTPVYLADLARIFRKERNTLHDDIAGTRVIKFSKELGSSC